MCGEHGRSKAPVQKHPGSSPHVRGAPTNFTIRYPGTGIIPACAGSTRCAARWPSPAGDHPRMCGEHSWSAMMAPFSMGSSPHVRGALRFLVDHGYAPGIIPACAGSTIHQYVSELDGRDHPRMCGEHLPLSLITMATWGSSPHVRGARVGMASILSDCGIIPACAGSTWNARGNLRLTWDHPRMCGEHALYAAFASP